MSSPLLQFIDAPQLKDWIHDENELALLDIREHGQYGEDHLFFAVPLPYSVLELDIFRLVPVKSTRIVVYADDSSQAIVPAAAEVLFRLGYTQVFALRGGIAAWKQAGYASFAGVNLPSKTFGEIAEHLYNTPRLPATELHAMLQDKKADVIVLDGRPIEEYRKMSIPGAICCPNGELALRINELVPSPNTTIVINCAGRTRSIIGAQTLINLNIPNQVYALENGTQGWYLADLPLEHKSNRLYPETIAEDSKPMLQARSAQLIEKFQLKTVDAASVKSWLHAGTRNIFLCDVRTRDEYQQNMPAYVQHAPGGQLIQATDQYVGVRKATIVICDFDGIRAPVTASWLKQLGWDVCLLIDPQNLSELPDPAQFVPELKHTVMLDAAHLGAFIRDNTQARIFDVRPSQEYRKNHLQCALWAIRSTLQAHLDARPKSNNAAPIILLGSDIGKLQVLAHDLERNGHTGIYLCAVDDKTLAQTGLPMESSDNIPPDAECIDYLFFVHDRHDGNKAAARKYLEWETNLISQIDEQERNTFSIQP
ncbi:MAG TPA: rhodanese-like domain-containing protein [Candidimonas sp.]|nr:rhodanese-like domain-containing protein [Candidimonas sp.]